MALCVPERKLSPKAKKNHGSDIDHVPGEEIKEGETDNVAGEGEEHRAAPAEVIRDNPRGNLGEVGNNLSH